MADSEVLEEIRQLRAEVASVAATANELKSMVEDISKEVHSDHEKLGKIEETAKQDHKMLQAMEETKRTLETTGRINVKRPPVGL